MANVTLENITVKYGENTIVKNLDLQVKEGEILAIVGPSGCGKTTIMRALCGFVKPTEGTIKVGERVVYSKEKRVMVAPEKRGIGVVFQDYAVWPHLTVLQNVVYPLRKMKIKREEASRRAVETIAQVRMEGYAERMPAQLSGGQQQRVAIGRALVSSNELIVLDEPITNLDAKLREEMVYEIQNLQKNIGATIIYITHDQETAMMIADRIVILNKQGEVCQIGTPDQIIKSPETKFVFEFIGVSNFIPIRLKGTTCCIKSKDGFLEYMCSNKKLEKVKDRPLVLATRPTDILLKQEGKIKARINRAIYVGNQYDYFVQVGDYEVRVQQDAFDASQTKVYKEGEACAIEFINPSFYVEGDEVRIC